MELEELKIILQKYNSTTNTDDFYEDDILSEIETSKSKIKEVIKTGNKNISELLKSISMKIDLMKKENDRLGIEECTKCINLLNKMKGDIENIKEKEDSVKRKSKILIIVGIVLVGILCIKSIINNL